MNTEEFKRLVPVLQPPMQRMAERMLDSKADAKDLVQDLMIELWQQRHRLSKVANLEGYCVRMVQFKSIDLLKSRPALQGLSEIAYDSDSDTEGREYLFEELQRRISDLPEEERQLLKMRYWEHTSGREMSRRLDISEGNVRVRLNRVISKLRDGFSSETPKNNTNMKKTLMIFILSMLTVVSLKAQEPRVWEVGKQKDSLRHSISLMYSPTLHIYHTSPGYGIDYGFKLGNRWELTASVEANQCLYTVPADPASSWEIHYSPDGQVLYSGPGLDYETAANLYFLGGLRFHLLKKPNISKLDPYLGLSFGGVFHTFTDYYLISDREGCIKRYEITPFVGFTQRLNAGLQYRFSNHWSAVGELSMTTCTVLISESQVGSILSGGLQGVFTGRLGINYRF